MFEVVFQHNESDKKWKVIVKGATSQLEALQGFNSVIITSQQATPTIKYNHARLCEDGTYEISVGV